MGVSTIFLLGLLVIYLCKQVYTHSMWKEGHIPQLSLMGFQTALMGNGLLGSRWTVAAWKGNGCLCYLFKHCLKVC